MKNAIRDLFDDQVEMPASAPDISGSIRTNARTNAAADKSEKQSNMITPPGESTPPETPPPADAGDVAEYELEACLDQSDDGTGKTRLRGTLKTHERQRSRNKNAERQARFDAKKRKQGLRRIYVYVPPEVAEEVRQFAKEVTERFLNASNQRPEPH